jgi:hypothetical protein
VEIAACLRGLSLERHAETFSEHAIGPGGAAEHLLL